MYAATVQHVEHASQLTAAFKESLYETPRARLLTF